MSSLRPIGIASPRRLGPTPARAEQVVRLRALHRVLAFTGNSIDDVVNNPVAKRQVLGYYKLHKRVERGCVAVDLERWWNGKSE